MMKHNKKSNRGFSFVPSFSYSTFSPGPEILRFQGSRLSFGRYFRILTRAFLLIAMALATAGTAGAVTVNWSRSGTANVTGYKIYYGTASGNYTGSVTTGNTTSGIINGLNPGVYYFTVAAFDANGTESAYSGEMSYAVPAGRGTGGPPIQLTVNAAKQVMITGQGLPGASYDVQYSTNFTTWMTLVTTTADSSGNIAFADPTKAVRPMCLYRLLGR